MAQYKAKDMQKYRQASGTAWQLQGQPTWAAHSPGATVLREKIMDGPLKARD